MFLLEDFDDQIVEIHNIIMVDTFTKHPSIQMKKYLDDNNVPYKYYYYSRETMSNEILRFETMYEPNKFPMVVVEVVTQTSDYMNKVDEDGEYVFEEKEDGYIYPVLEEVKHRSNRTIVYDTLEKLNKSKLLEKVSELGVKDVIEEN